MSRIVSSSFRFGRRQSVKPAKAAAFRSSIFSNACAHVYSLSWSWIEPSSDSFSEDRHQRAEFLPRSARNSYERSWIVREDLGERSH